MTPTLAFTGMDHDVSVDLKIKGLDKENMSQLMDNELVFAEKNAMYTEANYRLWNSGHTADVVSEADRVNFLVFLAV